MKILRLLQTFAEEVDDADAVEVVAARGYPWQCRVLADVPVFVRVGGVATQDAFFVNEFQPYVLAVGAGETVSVLGSDAGKVWCTHVKESA